MMATPRRVLCRLPRNLGLFNVAVTSSVTEMGPGFFRKGICPFR